MTLLKSKAILAKLMATENLVVEQRKVETASFNTLTRVLTIPIFDKDISPDVYDMLLGHEVGHALWTNPKDLMDLKSDISLDYINVIEDIRIERMIKNKYPGLRNSFIRGYRELFERGFFGVDESGINNLSFIDRLNIYSKCGSSYDIKFTDEELEMISKIENNLTFSDVVESTKMVSLYAQKEFLNLSKFGFGDSNSFPMNLDDVEGFDIDDEQTDGETEKFGPGAPGAPERFIVREPKTPEDESTETVIDSKQDGELPEEQEPEPEMKSETLDALEENLKKLVASDNAPEYIYGNVPDVDLNLMIVDHKKLWKRYRKDSKNMLYNFDHHSKTNMERFIKFRSDAKKVVSYLVKEFELKKNAQQSKKAMISKTGELDMNKVFSHNFNEDIFKKVTTVPGGKSHGIVIVLDWSGSMVKHFSGTVKQLINLALFCRRVNIPFEVYGFTSHYYDEEKRIAYVNASKPGDMAMNSCNMMNIISSRMTAPEFNFACSELIYFSNNSRYFGRDLAWFGLGGTPLDEAIVATMNIVPKFKKDYKIDIVNVVFMTDGDGAAMNEVYTKDCLFGRSTEIARYGRSHLIIRDKVTKEERKLEYGGYDETKKAYVDLLKQRTGCNVIGFYILSGGRDFTNATRRYIRRKENESDPFFYSRVEKLRKDFLKSGYMVVGSESAFDEYYLLRSDIEDDEDEGFTVKENASTRSLVTAFSKYVSNRVDNRVVLNRFIELIS